MHAFVRACVCMYVYKREHDNNARSMANVVRLAKKL